MTGMIEVMSQYYYPRRNESTQTFPVGIRKGAAWYNQHLSQTRSLGRAQRANVTVIVLLTDDAENRRRAEAEGVRCLSGEVISQAGI